ncbi:hypothetical protein B0H11DRAFT_1000010 [Mycena galericulata]|nr:hypothetical protein B0H11DRAFT_1000010 [Mycena galericulata]
MDISRGLRGSGRAAQFTTRDERCGGDLYEVDCTQSQSTANPRHVDLPLSYTGLDITIVFSSAFHCTQSIPGPARRSVREFNRRRVGDPPDRISFRVHGQDRNAARNKVTTMALLHERTLRYRATDTTSQHYPGNGPRAPPAHGPCASCGRNVALRALAARGGSSTRTATQMQQHPDIHLPSHSLHPPIRLPVHLRSGEYRSPFTPGFLTPAGGPPVNTPMRIRAWTSTGCTYRRYLGRRERKGVKRERTNKVDCGAVAARV